MWSDYQLKNERENVSLSIVPSVVFFYIHLLNAENPKQYSVTCIVLRVIVVFGRIKKVQKKVQKKRRGVIEKCI